MRDLHSLPSGRPNPLTPYSMQPAAPPAPAAHWESHAVQAAAHYITFGEVLAALWRQKLLVLSLVAVSTVIGLALAFSQPPIYQAKALIEISGINENFLNRREIDPTVEGGGAMEFASYLQNQIKLLQTDRLLGRVADRLHLDDAPEFQPKAGLLSRLKSQLSPQPPAAKANKRRAVLATLAAHLKVRLAGETHMIEVAYESTSPETAAAVANTLAEEYVARNLEKRVGTTQYMAKWLQGQLVELKGNLTDAERDLQHYLTTHDLLSSSDANKDGAAEARYRQLQMALTAAQEARITDQSRYELVSKMPVQELSNAVENPTITAYETKLTDLKEKIAEARAVYAPSHYKVLQLQAEMMEVQAALEKERRQLLNRLRGQYQSAAQKERMINSDLQAQSGVVRTQAARAVEYNTLRQPVETYRKLYDSTLQRMKEAELAAAIQANNVQIAENATAPAAPTGPSKPIYGSAGMFAGILAGAIIALYRDRSNRVLRTPGDLQARLGVPEFGTIPSAAIDLPFAAKAIAAGAPRAWPYVKQYARPPAEENELLRNWLETVAWRQRESALAEAYRGALASLLHAGGGQPPRVVVFTSACAGEGKTTTVTNLAIAMAESGRTVLLIDADRRRPHLHRVFKRPNDWGFSNVLLESTPAAATLARVVIPTEVPRLYILPAGSDSSCVPNLVDNQRAADLLAAARQHFDAVLIDTPPMMALSDARGLGRMADGVALVVRADKTPENIVAAATERLRQDGTRVLGTILNQCQPAALGKNYYEQQAGYGYRRSSGPKPQ